MNAQLALLRFGYQMMGAAIFWSEVDMSILTLEDVEYITK